MRSNEKMKSKLILSTLFCIAVFSILTASSVKADTNVTVDVWADGNVNFDSNLVTNGTIDINIDGTNFNQAIQDVSGDINSKVGWTELGYIFDQVTKYFYGTTANPHPTAISIFNSLNSVFVNRADEQVINAKLDNLNYRVIALEKSLERLNSTVYCQAKLEVMQEYNLSWVKCGENSTYYYNNVNSANGKIIVGIESLDFETTTTIPTTTTTIPTTTIQNTTQENVEVEKQMGTSSLIDFDYIINSIQQIFNSIASAW